MTAETERERAEQITSQTPPGRFGEPENRRNGTVAVFRSSQLRDWRSLMLVDGGWNWRILLPTLPQLMQPPSPASP